MPIIQLQYYWPASWFVDGFFVNLTGLGLFGMQFLLIILDGLLIFSAYLICSKLYGRSEAKLAILLLTIAPISMGYRWYSAQSFSLFLYFLILLPLHRLINSNDFSTKNLSVLILLSLLIITSHSITSIILLFTYLFLFVVKAIKRDYRSFNFMFLVFILFILWNLSNSENNLIKPYFYNMINSSISQILLSIKQALSPSYSNTVGINSINSNIFGFLVLYRYLFYLIIALFSISTLLSLIKKRMDYYLIYVGISVVCTTPFLSFISGTYVFRIITHWGIPLLCIFSSYAFVKQLNKKQTSLLYSILFMLFFAYFISGSSLYKYYSSDTYSYYTLNHMKSYLSDVKVVSGTSHFYEYFLTESILTKSTIYFTHKGINELLTSYDHLIDMLSIVSLQNIAGSNTNLNLINNDDSLIFDSQYIHFYFNG